MRAGVVVGGVALGWTLACGGMVELEAIDEPPADPAVDELLAAERGEDAEPTDEERTARVAALTAFLAATTDFADWKDAVLDCLEADCAETTEAAYAEAKVDYAEKPPVEAIVVTEPWKVLVIVNHVYGGSEDWGFFTAEVQEALPAASVATVTAGLGQYAVSVKKDGAEVGTVDLKPFVSDHEPKVGYVFAKAGADAQWQDHAQVPDVLGPACAFFEVECEDGGDDEDEEAAEPAPEPEPAAEPKPRQGGQWGGKAKGGKGR